MPFLTPSQQRQRTEGKWICSKRKKKVELKISTCVVIRKGKVDFELEECRDDDGCHAVMVHRRMNLIQSLHLYVGTLTQSLTGGRGNETG